MEQKGNDRRYFECETCHLKFRNKTFLESHVVMEHQKKLQPCGVQ